MCKIEATNFYMEINHKAKNTVPQIFTPDDVIQFLSDYQDKIEDKSMNKSIRIYKTFGIKILTVICYKTRF